MQTAVVLSHPTSPTLAIPTADNSWWQARKRSAGEVLGDLAVHLAGLGVAGWPGLAFVQQAELASPQMALSMQLYVGAMQLLFVVSLLYNVLPNGAARRLMARLDQAAIFVFIAATETPLICASPSHDGGALLCAVWAVAGLGSALKLTVPAQFGRKAIPVYVTLGVAGLLAYPGFSTQMTPEGAILLLAGGGAYLVGLYFNVNNAIRFNSAIWHIFVVTAATLQLLAIGSLIG